MRNSCVPAGEKSGGFSFTVTDGEHTTPLYQFVVTARPLTITMVTQEELVVFPGSTDILQTRKLHLLFDIVGKKLLDLPFSPFHTWEQAIFRHLVFKCGIAVEELFFFFLFFFFINIH